MTEATKYTLQAISDVKNPSEIRVVIFINNELVHVPLSALLKEVKAQLTDLDTRVTALEP